MISGCHSLPSLNIPGTPSALARRGPAKPSPHREVKRASPRASTHTETHYLGWGLHSHQDYKNKHNTIKMDSSLSPFPHPHPFPGPTHTPQYYPESSKTIWTTQRKKVGWESIEQGNPQNYEHFFAFIVVTEVLWHAEGQHHCATVGGTC